MLAQQMSENEIAVLRFLGTPHAASAEQLREITDIAVDTGIRSNEEVQRALYILEGKSLVTPEPVGDLTSNQWKITEIGERALTMISSEAAA